ncbi:MAG: hypothetical protein QNJ54_37470 [Prochloraceae cyanobacterium]|nr:hypothetical protein [Prochloraceae cyanobacterium]
MNGPLLSLLVILLFSIPLHFSQLTASVGEDGGNPCKPLVHQEFLLDHNVPLTCNFKSSKKIFDLPIDDRGYALGRAILKIRHTGKSEQIHFWNASVVIGDGEYPYGIGDDLCKGYQDVTKVNFGYGKLSDTNKRAVVLAHQGSNPCTEGTIEILAGSKLDLWIEDNKPQCKNNNIEYLSYYKTRGFLNTYVWRTLMSPILTKAIHVDKSSQQALIMSVVEGSPDNNPNKICGGETAMIASDIVLDDNIIDQNIRLLPASSGQGHLVLYNGATRTLERGCHIIELRVGSNINLDTSKVKTGGCCGDGAIFIVKQ